MLTDQTKDSFDFLEQHKPYSQFKLKKIKIILTYFDFQLISKQSLLIKGMQNNF